MFLDLNTKTTYTKDEMKAFYVADYLPNVDSGDIALNFPQWITEITTNGDYVEI